MIGVELFSGAGGMSVGANLAGIDVQAAVEIHPVIAKTFCANHKSARMYNTDIRNISDIDVGPRVKELVVFGGPPCQGFSTSNQRTRTTENSSNWLFIEFVRLIDKLRPEWVVFENVAGIVHTEKGVFLREITRLFSSIGYSISCGLLNAVDFGIPQSRTRFFLVGRLGGRAPQLPSPPIGAKRLTVRDAIEDLPILENGASVDSIPYSADVGSSYAQMLRGTLERCGGHIVTRNADRIIERYKFIPQGGNWESIPPELMTTYADVSRCHTGIYRRLDWNAPSVVLGNFRKNMLIHPNQDRGLSVREAARLQSFPDSFNFLGSIGLQQQQVGNAVPPLLAKAVFSTITGK